MIYRDDDEYCEMTVKENIYGSAIRSKGIASRFGTADVCRSDKNFFVAQYFVLVSESSAALGGSKGAGADFYS
jgi:hypothetical protein